MRKNIFFIVILAGVAAWVVWAERNRKSVALISYEYSL